MSYKYGDCDHHLPTHNVIASSVGEAALVALKKIKQQLKEEGYENNEPEEENPEEIKEHVTKDVYMIEGMNDRFLTILPGYDYPTEVGAFNVEALPAVLDQKKNKSEFVGIETTQFMKKFEELLKTHGEFNPDSSEDD
jgi:hypothetical protein